MARLQWLLVRTGDKIGFSAGLVWLLLLGGALYIVMVFLPAQQQLTQLEQQLSVTPKVQRVVYTYKSPSEQFFANVPQIDDVTTSIQAVFDVAKQQHIIINEVVYKDEQKAGESIVRYSMSFSVIASYPEIKAFIVNTLATLPYLALEQLTFERDETNPNSISSHLQFTLYLVR